MSGAASKQQHPEEVAEVSSPSKNKKPRDRAKQPKTDMSQDKGKDPTQDGTTLTGQKRKKQAYRPKVPPLLTTEAVNPLAVVVHQPVDAPVTGEEHTEDNESNDSHKKMRSGNNRSADQAAAVEQPHRTQ